MTQRTSQRGLVLATALVVGVAGCARAPAPAVPSASPISLPQTLRIQVAGTVAEVPLEQYVLGTVVAEIGSSTDTAATVTRIYELQAIISRTYAVHSRQRHGREGYDLCDSTHCQVYRPERVRTVKHATEARQAVADTRGVILAYGIRPIEALFHADCGGHTAAADAIWGNAVPYLIGTADAVPDGTHRVWTFSLAREALRTALNASEATRVGGELRGLRIATRDASGRAVGLEVTGEHSRLLRGEQLRSAINLIHGAQAVRSTRFALTRDDDTYTFTGTGWGHGVGLCQVGAMSRLRRGESVASVLGVYYPGVRLLRAS